ncbi:MAG: SGNH/GDSL hydrolase family protein [Bacteroidetes bacterium]|nr:SGNH/GDSL hydrolase family protein [Bacteroidota bacterium]
MKITEMHKCKQYLVFGGIILAMGSFVQKEKKVRYLPLGDSYTICTGATVKDSWPQLLTQHLNTSGYQVTLLDNPARNGFSTQDLIDKELPLVKKLKPDFVTLLIGVNDWVRHVPATTFKTNLILILDEVEKQLPVKTKILLITIPDFGVTKVGNSYSQGRDISKGISEFNTIIKEEGKKRNLTVGDVFELSKKMKDDKTLVAEDGLHPSAKEYALWETLILPEAKKVLQ